MAELLLGAVLILWALSLLGVAAISNTVLGILVLITGIIYLVAGLGVAMPRLPRRHVE